MVSWDEVRELALALPEVEVTTAYGTPALKVRKKFIARLREPNVVVLRVDLAEQELLVRGRPEAFFITPHYAGYPYVLCRLDAVDRDELAELLTDAWLIQAPKRVAAAYRGGA